MKNQIFILTIFLFIFSESSFANTGQGGKHLFSTGLMMLASSTEQGGKGTEGSTLLSQTEYVYNFGWWSAGLFYQYDKQGEVQQDSAVGPKLELNWRVFYIELGYIAQMNRSYTDRSIAEETGDGLFIGFGVRFNISGSWFFQGMFKQRTQNIKEQDGILLDEPIKQTDTYPLAGIGYVF